MNLLGLSLIGGAPAAPTGNTFAAVNPADGARLAPDYHEAEAAEVARAAMLAAEAAPVFARSTAEQRAGLLRAMADGIEALGDGLLERFVAETGLPRGRAEGERARTCGQLRMFADVAAADRWRDVREEPALPDRQPAPRPALSFRLRALGPVVVFGPANFPLAFSVAGGDTASALAVGCPVIVKAHSSHPGVSELVGRVVVDAVRATGLHPGVFSLLFGSGRTVGTALVRHPAVKAAGFTGSESAGRELFNLCASRPDPIPFFGELSSINPVCILPGALAANAEGIAAGLHGSLTLGCGQFCTNPGLVFYVEGCPGSREFLGALLEKARGTPATPMLNTATRESYEKEMRRVSGVAGVETLLAATTDRGPGGCHATPALFTCQAERFRGEEALHREVFGPATLLVVCASVEEMRQTLAELEGQLTATLHATEQELNHPATRALLETLEDRAGRVILNGYPTGVEVSPAMVHGGPWPATTDARFTSVGTAALLRWVRPVCRQGFPVNG